MVMTHQSRGPPVATTSTWTCLSYHLDRAADVASTPLEAVYRAEYGMTRTQWRVVTHLGQDRPMAAARICRLSHLNKTKVSRAVSVLKKRSWLARSPAQQDRRVELLSLTPEAREFRTHLAQRAAELQSELAGLLGPTRITELAQMLRDLTALSGDASKP